jgi:predicted CoA-binding protein
MMDPQHVLTHFRSFAVVGAIPKGEKYGHEVTATLLEAGYEVFPVNPNYSEILSHPCYPSLRNLPRIPDAVVIVVRPEGAAEAVEECARLGNPVVWMPPGCWSDAALDACHRHRLRSISDRCPVGELKNRRQREVA